MGYMTGNYETAKEVIDKALIHHPRFDEIIQNKEKGRSCI